MSFLVKQFLKIGIDLLDKENITQDQVEYVYHKWGPRVAERLVKMLEDETLRARTVLEKLKAQDSQSKLGRRSRIPRRRQRKTRQKK